MDSGKKPNGTQLNVLGTALAVCGEDPMTGFFRDGCCKTDATDLGRHTVCTELTDEFLRFSKERGNDLSTPHPEFDFPGLKAGQRWCLCAARWAEAYTAGKAPKVFLESTHAATLQMIPLAVLQEFAADL